MMDDQRLDMPSGDEPYAGIALVCVGEKYWLAQGDEWLQPLLTGEGEFPRPVLCVSCKDAFELGQFLGGSNVADLWGINPDIVARLRRDGHLTDLVFDAS